MLWLKAWLETRWRIAFATLMGVFLWGVPFLVLTSGPARDPRRILPGLLLILGNSGVLWALTMPIMLAGSGLRTALPRPGACEKSGEGSTAFTLSLPVTRTRLFVVRNAAGMLEAVALLMLFAVAIWLLLPAFAESAHDDLRYLLAIGSWSLAAYAISTCLSALFDNAGAQFRGSVLGLAVLFMVSYTGQLPGHARIRVLPQFIDIFRQLVAPLITHQTPWATIFVAWALTILFFAAALSMIQKRDY